jgi:hypothetical protein
MSQRLAMILVLAVVCLPSHPPAAQETKTAGTIVPTGDMTVPRFSHTATLLRDGRVLIAGGMAKNGVFEPTAEVYDPATGRFAPAGRLLWERDYGSTAALLPNGTVLIAAGSSGQCGEACALATAELYDPAHGTFTRTGSMSRAREVAISAMLPNGDVLVVGRTGPTESATADLYQPASGTFRATGTLQTSEAPLAAVTLANGKVLVIAGRSRNNVIEEARAEIYDPASGSFQSGGRMKVPRTKLGVARLPDGRVMVAGGQIDGPFGEKLSSTEIYDPGSDAFSPGPEMSFTRFKLPYAVVPLSTGRVLVAGGAERPEVFDPIKQTFLPARGVVLDGYSFSTATLLANGDVLIVGGYARPSAPAVNHAWIYRPSL